jgi:hypothetical protein
MAAKAKYLYGIVEKSQFREFGFSGVGDTQVYSINYGDVAAIVSDTEPQEIDPTRRNVLAHTVVQDRLLKECTLLPMRFGVIAGSEEEVRRLLEKCYDDILSELKRLTGKIEVELKMFWDKRAMVKELEASSKELRLLRARITATSSHAEAHNLLVKAGQLVERTALSWKTKYAQRVYGILKQFSIDSRLNKPVGVKNILNASFLIDRLKETEFQQNVRSLDSQCQGRVNFKYVGPLPPYNFVNLNLEPVKW